MDAEGHIICEWESITEACVGCGYAISSISWFRKILNDPSLMKSLHLNIRFKNEEDMEKRGSKQVEGIDLSGFHPSITFDSTMDAARVLGIAASNISACANGKIKTVGGYSWRYVE